MGQGRIESVGIRLKNFESFILELILLAYPLLLISENIRVSPHYLIIALAILAGIGSILLLDGKLDTTITRLILSLLVAGPLYFIGLPLTVAIIIYVYTFWRMNVNFGPERSTRWNFLFINTIAFASFYLFTRIYLLKTVAIEVNKVNVIIFLLTTILYIVLRYIGIILLGRYSSDFKLGENNKVFAAIMGVGLATYFAVYFFMESVRTAIIDIFAYLFGGLFKSIASALLPTIEQVEIPENKIGEVEEEVIYPIMNEETNISVYLLIAVVVLAVIMLVLIIRRRNVRDFSTNVKAYNFLSFGRRKKQPVTEKENDYSALTSAVRAAYQSFENDAITAKYPRYSGETVKEWFIRMNWAQDEKLFAIYDKARYGAMTVTEEERHLFVSELKKLIRITF